MNLFCLKRKHVISRVIEMAKHYHKQYREGTARTYFVNEGSCKWCCHETNSSIHIHKPYNNIQWNLGCGTLLIHECHSESKMFVETKTIFLKGINVKCSNPFPDTYLSTLS